MVDIPDRESLWGTVDGINPEIRAWLDERMADDEWDYHFLNGHVMFWIKDNKIATMFKLTWG